MKKQIILHKSIQAHMEAANSSFIMVLDGLKTAQHGLGLIQEKKEASFEEAHQCIEEGLQKQVHWLQALQEQLKLLENLSSQLEIEDTYLDVSEEQMKALVFDFLDRLEETEETEMHEAVPFIEAEFGLDENLCSALLREWKETSS